MNFFVENLEILIIGVEEVICGEIVCFEVDVKEVEFLSWLVIW